MSLFISRKKLAHYFYTGGIGESVSDRSKSGTGQITSSGNTIFLCSNASAISSSSDEYASSMSNEKITEDVETFQIN